MSIKRSLLCAKLKKLVDFGNMKRGGKIGGTDIPGPRLSDYLYARICSEACFYLFFRVEQQKNSCLMEMNDVRSAVEELNMEKVSNKCTTCLLSITRVLHLLCKSSSEFLKIFLKDRFIDHIPTIFYF